MPWVGCTALDYTFPGQLQVLMSKLRQAWSRILHQTRKVTRQHHWPDVERTTLHFFNRTMQDFLFKAMRSLIKLGFFKKV